MAGLESRAEKIAKAQTQVNYGGGGTDLTLHLYKNDKTPVDGDVAGDYTEATFTGYAAKTLTGASWVITASAPIKASYVLQTYNSSADQAVEYLYGYFVKRGAALVGSERFPDGPYAISLATDYIEVTPVFVY